ncbi:MAG TPA: hypothetical protein VNO30_28880 [Kofleriaceae bacterium]|nr:hypothetical protein [Kofleriaceae bacterium]
MIDLAIRRAVREAALRELEAAPYERTEPNANPRRGANHGSALAALSHNADPGDAPLLVRVLRENDDPRVLHEGVGAAEPVLRGEPAHPELVEVLAQLASRRDVEPGTRAGAITAIGGANDAAVVPMLIASLADPELAVSAAAARVLLERDFERHRPLVAPVAAAWHTGEFPPFDVHEVRRLLEGDD